MRSLTPPLAADSARCIPSHWPLLLLVIFAVIFLNWFLILVLLLIWLLIELLLSFFAVRWLLQSRA